MVSSEESLQEPREWSYVTPPSIGDAVITTDSADTFLIPVAQSLTGYTRMVLASVSGGGHPRCYLSQGM